MYYHSTAKMTGFFTQAKNIRGRTLKQIEAILGFRKGRFAKGVKLFVLLELPQKHQFDLRGYTQIAGHEFQKKYGSAVQHLEQSILKELAINAWSISGPNQLVKVEPFIRHCHTWDEERLSLEYPAGKGAPQWELTENLPMAIISEFRAYPHEKVIW